jgi:hypothetical protein
LKRSSDVASTGVPECARLFYLVSFYLVVAGSISYIQNISISDIEYPDDFWRC